MGYSLKKTVFVIRDRINLERVLLVSNSLEGRDKYFVPIDEKVEKLIVHICGQDDLHLLRLVNLESFLINFSDQISSVVFDTFGPQACTSQKLIHKFCISNNFQVTMIPHGTPTLFVKKRSVRPVGKIKSADVVYFSSILHLKCAGNFYQHEETKCLVSGDPKIIALFESRGKANKEFDVGFFGSRLSENLSASIRTKGLNLNSIEERLKLLSKQLDTDFSYLKHPRYGGGVNSTNSYRCVVSACSSVLLEALAGGGEIFTVDWEAIDTNTVSFFSKFDCKKVMFMGLPLMHIRPVRKTQFGEVLGVNSQLVL